jgi:mannonate dehydratase
MIPSLRWFGPDDPVPLGHIRQIPGVKGIVTSLHDVPPGVAWTADGLEERGESLAREGLDWVAVESLPVPEEVKLGGPGRDAALDAWCLSLERIGAAGVPVVCWNFMPVFDWVRTDLDFPLADGSTALAYDQQALERIQGASSALPGWAEERLSVAERVAAYAGMDDERLWENLTHFLEAVVPVAEASKVRLAVHPDDPPWPVWGLPRILGDGPSLRRLVGVVDSPANGVTFCTGSLGARPDNDLPAMVRELGERIHFVHARNVLRTGPRRFHETAHPSAQGSLDLGAVFDALGDVGFTGPYRPDHGRRIWGEGGRAGYGLFDRALGLAYLEGIREGLARRAPHAAGRGPTSTSPEPT